MTSRALTQFFVRRALIVACVLAAVAMASPASASSVAAPHLRVTSGPYRDDQYISISVGPNRYFAPHHYINILECSDAGGKKANLPTSIADCDESTIQPLTILVSTNGSFKEKRYQLFTLPNLKELGETSSSRPICDSRHYCVLYIGEDQEKFTQPKVFSAPFRFVKSRS